MSDEAVLNSLINNLDWAESSDVLSSVLTATILLTIYYSMKWQSLPALY